MRDTLKKIRVSRVQNNLPVLSLASEERLVKLFLGSKLSIKLLFHARVLSLQGVEDMSLKDIEYYGIWYLAKVGAKTVSHDVYGHYNEIEAVFAIKLKPDRGCKCLYSTTVHGT